MKTEPVKIRKNWENKFASNPNNDDSRIEPLLDIKNKFDEQEWEWSFIDLKYGL